MARVGREELCRVVREALRLGVLGPGLVSSILGVSPGEAQILLSLMESQGWVERVEAAAGTGCPCSRCPLRRVCPLGRGAAGSSGGSVSGLYRVTRRALEACRV